MRLLISVLAGTSREESNSQKSMLSPAGNPVDRRLFEESDTDVSLPIPGHAPQTAWVTWPFES